MVVVLIAKEKKDVTKQKNKNKNLLQVEELNASPGWHFPFQLAGTGGIPTSLKLGDSGQIPVLISNQVNNVFKKDLFFGANFKIKNYFHTTKVRTCS